MSVGLLGAVVGFLFLAVIVAAVVALGTRRPAGPPRLERRLTRLLTRAQRSRPTPF